MSEAQTSLGLGLFALAPIACCIGPPLIATAGVSVALTVWVDGSALAVLVAIAVIALLVVRECGPRRS